MIDLLYYQNGDGRMRVRKRDWAPDAWELLEPEAFEALRAMNDSDLNKKFSLITLLDGDLENENEDEVKTIEVV